MMNRRKKDQEEKAEATNKGAVKKGRPVGAKTRKEAPQLDHSVIAGRTRSRAAPKPEKGNSQEIPATPKVDKPDTLAKAKLSLDKRIRETLAANASYRQDETSTSSQSLTLREHVKEALKPKEEEKGPPTICHEPPETSDTSDSQHENNPREEVKEIGSQASDSVNLSASSTGESEE